MSDRNKPIDPSDERRLLKRGKGVGKDYQPFICVQDLSSTGESVRVSGCVTGRTHHLLSGIELAAFAVFDWHSATIDIREQYPLPIEDTLLICQNLGIRHPQYQGKLKVVTTDLLIDFSDREQLAVAVKPVLALDDERTVEKLQVEKSFWQSLGVEWKLFTEREVPKIVRENLLWLRPVMDENNNDTSHDEMEVRELLHRVSELGQRSVTKACATLDDQYGVEAGSHLQVLRYGVAKRMIQAPIQTSFHGWKCSEISLAVAPSLMGAKHAN